MLNQQVSVDYWAMSWSMLTYGALTALCWLMLRLFSAAFTLPRRMRAHQQTIQDSLQELQRRYPDLCITEEDLINAEKELEEYIKEDENKRSENKEPAENPDSAEISQIEEDKKTL